MRLRRAHTRMMGAARFLAATFSEYERYVARLNVCDEHALRSFVLAGQAAEPIRAVKSSDATSGRNCAGRLIYRAIS